ncbi:cyclase family protein [Chloroflexota bacterium]
MKKIIDLSTPFDSDWSVPEYPGIDAYHKLYFNKTRPKDGSYSAVFTLTSHSGTHIDAPMHRFTKKEKKGKYYVDDWPLEQLYGETVVLDMPKGELEPITAHDFEQSKIEIKAGDIVLVHTGWGKYFQEEPKNCDYLYTKRPGLEVDGAEWLIKRKIKAYGQDTLGTQYPKHTFHLDEKSLNKGVPCRKLTEPVHDLMLSNDIVLVEHLVNLDKIAGRRVITAFFPLYFKGIDACPVRAVAFIEE